MRTDERAGEAIGESTTSVAVGTPSLKVPQKEDEAWHHEESPEEASGESTAQLLQKTSGFLRCQYHGTTAKDSRSHEQA